MRATLAYVNIFMLLIMARCFGCVCHDESGVGRSLQADDGVSECRAPSHVSSLAILAAYVNHEVKCQRHRTDLHTSHL
jgi:hypothetical protein